LSESEIQLKQKISELKEKLRDLREELKEVKMRERNGRQRFSLMMRKISKIEELISSVDSDATSTEESAATVELLESELVQELGIDLQNLDIQLMKVHDENELLVNELRKKHEAKELLENKHLDLRRNFDRLKAEKRKDSSKVRVLNQVCKNEISWLENFSWEMKKLEDAGGEEIQSEIQKFQSWEKDIDSTKYTKTVGQIVDRVHFFVNKEIEMIKNRQIKIAMLKNEAEMISAQHPESPDLFKAKVSALTERERFLQKELDALQMLNLKIHDSENLEALLPKCHSYLVNTETRLNYQIAALLDLLQLDSNDMKTHEISRLKLKELEERREEEMKSSSSRKKVATEIEELLVSRCQLSQHIVQAYTESLENISKVYRDRQSRSLSKKLEKHVEEIKIKQ
jgi:hypothetical protein